MSTPNSITPKTRILISIRLMTALVMSRIQIGWRFISRCVDDFISTLMYRDSIGDLYIFLPGTEGMEPIGHLYIQEQRDQGVIRERVCFSVANSKFKHKPLTGKAVSEIQTFARIQGYRVIWVEQNGKALSPFHIEGVALSHTLVSRTEYSNSDYVYEGDSAVVV